MTEQTTTNIPEISLADVTKKIRSLYRYLLSKWLIILIVAFIGGIAGITYAWMQTPKYAAVLTFSMEDEKSSGGGLAGLAAQFGLDLGTVGGAFTGENIVVLVQSNRMIESTLLSDISVNGKQESLLNYYLDIYDFKKGFSKSPDKELRNLTFPDKQDPSTFTRLQDSVLLLVINAMQKGALKTEKPEARMNLYSITCKSEDETFSIEFCKQLIKNVSEFYVDTKTKRSAKIVDILQKRADSVKTAFNNALLGRAELSDANINTALQLPAVGIQRKQTDVTVLATAYGELLKNLEIAKFNLLNETPLIQVIDEPVAPLEKKKLGRLLGGLIGGFIMGLLCVIYLTAKKAFKQKSVEA